MFLVVGVLYRNNFVWLVVLLVVRRVAGGVRVVAFGEIVAPSACRLGTASFFHGCPLTARTI